MLLKWRRFILLEVKGTIIKSSSDQVCSTKTSCYQPRICVGTSQVEDSIFKSKNRHLHKCEYSTNQCIQGVIQGSWLCYAGTKQQNGITTYTTQKINVLGFCYLFVVHPDRKCLKKITFQVVKHEGSVIVSCVTSLELGLIQLHSVFNESVPDCWRLLYSEADHPNKCKYKNIRSSSSVRNNASSIEV